MITLSLRHLRHHWRLNLALLLCLTLASATLVSLSSSVAGIATQELQQTLAQAQPKERSILVTGTPYTFSDELHSLFQKKLGTALKDRLVIRHTQLSADPQPLSKGAAQSQAAEFLDVYSFDNLASSVRVVEGRLPAQVHLSEAIGRWPPPVEAVLGARAAEQSGYSVGDELSASRRYHRLDIVGIVEPLDPGDDRWGQDLSAFTVPSDTAQAPTLPLIIAAKSMQSYLLGPIFPHQIAWRYTIDQQSIDKNNARALHSNLINVQTQATTQGAKIDTGLVQILTESVEQLTQMQMPFLLITILILVLVLYALTLLVSFFIDHARAEVETLSGQGASAWQISRIFALEALYLAAPAALLLGPGLAKGVLYLWAETSGVTAPGALPREAWLLSVTVGGLGWLALALSVRLAARRVVRGGSHTRAQAPQQTVFQKHYVDLYLLAFGAVLYWQLNQTGSFVMRRLGNSRMADPLLLVGPSLLFIALALISLRVLPLLLRTLARPFQALRGTVLPLSLLRLARDTGQAGYPVLLISLTSGLGLYLHTIAVSLTEQPSGTHAAALQPVTLLQASGSALELNMLMLTLFGVCAFLTIQTFNAQTERRQDAIQTALGLSARQGLACLVIESAVVLLLGLVVGIILGLGLAYIMAPYFSQALAALGAAFTRQTTIRWPAVAQFILLLLVAYSLALAFLLLLTAVRRQNQRRP